LVGFFGEVEEDASVGVGEAVDCGVDCDPALADWAFVELEADFELAELAVEDELEAGRAWGRVVVVEDVGALGVREQPASVTTTG